MNIQAYIESGILEEYVLGTVTPQEKQEVECMSHIYPEIKEELLRTESALEEYALKHQATPPPSLKESIFAQMNFDAAAEEDTTSDETTDEKIVPLVEGTAVAQPVDTDTRVIENAFERVETKEVTPFWSKLAVAAAVLLALFAGWSSIRMSDMKANQEELAAETNRMKLDMARLDKEVEYNQALANLFRSPTYKHIHLAGLDKSPESSVSAFWNTQTNEVLIDVQNLPAAPQGKQYQLWSIVDGKPVDIGMIDNAFTGKVLKMKNTKAGSVAFAITLEKEGGNPTPTMEEMYVMGKVS
ncbi:Anti-sigma-K factor rskA [Dyadobacter sp. SG02]|uniref:anti-sigma factor n=1 Tax=Dyadobacter sp. SG02 TaxID=1855291 RepID=UPI0008CB4618|nr:anti-sigma factor [Dyadobacter sp. SG02]SEJ30317.1 Anti-sigma-K factor rskA [Dyadobacter sp. SG02]